MSFPRPFGTDLFQNHWPLLLPAVDWALPPTLLSSLVSSSASLTTLATSISFFLMEAGSLLFFPGKMAFRSPRAFPSFLTAVSADALPALFSLDLAFSKATSKSDCVDATMFLAVLQALSTFSNVSSLSSGVSWLLLFLALPFPKLLPFPWLFPEPLPLG